MESSIDINNNSNIHKAVSKGDAIFDEGITWLADWLCGKCDTWHYWITGDQGCSDVVDYCNNEEDCVDIIRCMSCKKYYRLVGRENK